MGGGRLQGEQLAYRGATQHQIRGPKLNNKETEPKLYRNKQPMMSLIRPEPGASPGTSCFR